MGTRLEERKIHAGEQFLGTKRFAHYEFRRGTGFSAVVYIGLHTYRDSHEEKKRTLRTRVEEESMKFVCSFPRGIYGNVNLFYNWPFIVYTVYEYMRAAAA